VKYQRTFERGRFLRESFAWFALRASPLDFGRTRPKASIIGDWISDRIRAEGIYERDILEFLRARILDPAVAARAVALDVGANIGNHSLFLSDIFERVIAFEPNPLARSLLEINLDMNGVTTVDVRPVGLSDHRGSATLVFDPINLGAASSSEPREESRAARRSVIDVVVGDEAIDRSARVAFIKVDVEGAEEAVLRGLEQTLRAHKPVVMMEQWPDVIDAANGTSPSTSFLIELGYTAWEIKRGHLFRGQLGKISALLLGCIDYFLDPLPRLEKREYPALIFTPPSYVFPPRS
jgi:FkbM family methyltransferase